MTTQTHENADVMTETCEAARKVQDGLEPYIKPREQVNYIRRILALHLNSFSQDAPLNQPLPLPATSHDVLHSPPDTKGLYLEYFEALKANSAARQQLEGLSQARPRTPEQQTSEAESSSVNHLDERLAILKLEQKRQKLSTVRKYLDHLVDQPAASPKFLDADQIFANSPKLPSVPKQIVDSLVVASTGQSSDLNSRVNNLEKTVLRAKLRLRHEEKLLDGAKARSRNRPDVVSNGVRREALNATRAELIDWIETELSMASGEGPVPETEPGLDGHGNVENDQAAIEGNLSEVKGKYSRYLESRKRVIQFVSNQSAAPSKPDLTPSSEAPKPERPPSPVNHLLVPYIERLLALSKTQKSMISQKSHISSLLNTQLKDTCQTLGHLAEESQLLPTYPMKDSLRRRSGLVSELTSKKSGAPDIANRIKPWVFASDAAKIASLEAVAETIEGGQLSLEESMKALEELESLLGLTQEQDENKEVENEGATEEDMWLDQQDYKGKASRKHTAKPSGKKPGDIWSTLHGNLGLLGQEDAL